MLMSPFSVHTTITQCPVTKTFTNEKTTSVEVFQSESTVYETVTSTICTKCYGPSPAPVAVIAAGPSPPTVTEAGVAAIPEVPGSPASFAVVTMTIVPVSDSPAPVPADSDVPAPQPAPPSESPVDSPLFPGKASPPYGSTGTSFASSPAFTAGPTGPTIDAFKGAASRTGAGVLGCLVIGLMAALML